MVRWTNLVGKKAFFGSHLVEIVAVYRDKYGLCCAVSHLDGKINERVDADHLKLVVEEPGKLPEPTPCKIPPGDPVERLRDKGLI